MLHRCALQMFEGGSSLKYQLPKSIAFSRAKDMQRPSFNVAYPSGMKEWVLAIPEYDCAILCPLSDLSSFLYRRVLASAISAPHGSAKIWCWVYVTYSCSGTFFQIDTGVLGLGSEQTANVCRVHKTLGKDSGGCRIRQHRSRIRENREEREMYCNVAFRFV